MRIQFLSFFLLLTALSCSPGASDAASSTETEKLPVVRPDSGHLIFSWFEDGHSRTATAPSEVPESARSDVRVLDPTIPPDKSNPGIVFIADLTRPKPDGAYPVSAISRDAWDARRAPATSPEAETPASTNNTSAVGGVIMYATVHCPHCHRARRWLLEQKIPYREIDIEKNTAAAQALEEKGRAQGVATGGVPMFEINGKLLPGFNPDEIRRALSLPAPNKALPGGSRII